MADENLKKEMEETVEDQADGTTEEAVEDTAEETAESANETPESDESDEEADKDDADKDSGDGKEVKKGFFGKKKDKKDKKDVQIEELTDRLKRQMAEFENFRKRTEKEKSAMFEVGAKSVIEKMLPVVDNFERGLAAVPDDKKDDPFVEGMEKIYKQLIGTLEELEVKAIEAVGQEFDPNFHNAVMHIEDEELGDNIVAEEFQKGYTYRENVVRHSMVKVAN
ncbi:nucleotide exchange factor GrpE [Robinsoniella sp.]|uniref:nucleotide exchange factor GrpE n=1 Tax=Robinsoniella sp. TaxID=2496533 RepID=UPI00375317ED